MFRREYPFKRSNPISRRSILKNGSDSLFRDMKKYQIGYNENGDPRFSVPLNADEDGLLGRECAGNACSLRYFKISVDEDDSRESPLDDAQMHCPYCGHTDNFQEFHTKDQIKHVESMMVRDVEQTMTDILNRSFRSLNNSRGLIRITMKATANLPPLHRYVEEKLKQTNTCPQCSQRYAVYGISFNCPFCGGGTISVHLRDSIQTVRVLALEAEEIGQKHGAPVHDKMLGNAYEDVVTTFEGFLRRIYVAGLRKTRTPAEVEELEAKVRNSFQRLDGAEELMRRDLSVKLFDGVDPTERDRLGVVFAKRHTLTHNLGLVDQKYREQAKAWEKPGQEVPLDANEVLWAIECLERLLTQAIAMLSV
jgi:C4-type Zn-finger protein